MEKASDVYKMAQEYVSQVYKGKAIHPTQRDESEQHFIMGVHAGVQLIQQMPLEKIRELDKDIREYQLKRVAELMKEQPYG